MDTLATTRVVIGNIDPSICFVNFFVFSFFDLLEDMCTRIRCAEQAVQHLINRYFDTGDQSFHLK